MFIVLSPCVSYPGVQSSFISVTKAQLCWLRISDDPQQAELSTEPWLDACREPPCCPCAFPLCVWRDGGLCPHLPSGMDGAHTAPPGLPQLSTGTLLLNSKAFKFSLSPVCSLSLCSPSACCSQVIRWWPQTAFPVAEPWKSCCFYHCCDHPCVTGE